MLFDNATTKVEHTTASGFDVGQWSYGTWFFPIGTGEDGNGRLFVASEFAAGIRIRLRPANGAVDLLQTFDTTSGIWRSATNSISSLSVWYYLGISYDRTNVANVPSFYIWRSDVGGLLAQSATTTVTAPVGTASAITTGYCIGNVTGQTGTFNGEIVHSKFWNRILTLGEFQTEMMCPGSINSGLVLYCPLLTGTDARDLSGNTQNPTLTGAASGALPMANMMYGVNRHGWLGNFTPAAAGSVPLYMHQRLEQGLS